jgi:protein transport protein SEC61 subunit alpha
MWKQREESILKFVPISGLTYWLMPPTLSALSTEPFRVFVYFMYILCMCAFLSYKSIRGKDCRENPGNLIEDLLGPTHLTMAGIKQGDSDEALKKEVSRLVPVATILGGLILGMICVVSDMLGVIGGTPGMLISTSIFYNCYELWLKERVRFAR